ncbi:hypothetical protein DFH29DRAFT_881038 [Suillus ampliporus]|nr:hypothetical protein DFH29DRAFT_881038 [Suillus ampliporus]
MQQSLALKGCSRNLNLRIEINAKIENTQRGEGSEASISSGTDSEGAHLQLGTTLVTLDAVTDLQKRLEVAEKNCSHYFELYKKYRLRWLEENHRADILESPAQIQWDAPSPCFLPVLPLDVARERNFCVIMAGRNGRTCGKILVQM